MDSSAKFPASSLVHNFETMLQRMVGQTLESDDEDGTCFDGDISPSIETNHGDAAAATTVMESNHLGRQALSPTATATNAIKSSTAATANSTSATKTKEFDADADDSILALVSNLADQPLGDDNDDAAVGGGDNKQQQTLCDNLTVDHLLTEVAAGSARPPPLLSAASTYSSPSPSSSCANGVGGAASPMFGSSSSSTRGGGATSSASSLSLQLTTSVSGSGSGLSSSSLSPRRQMSPFFERGDSLYSLPDAGGQGSSLGGSNLSTLSPTSLGGAGGDAARRRLSPPEQLLCWEVLDSAGPGPGSHAHFSPLAMSQESDVGSSSGANSGRSSSGAVGSESFLLAGSGRSGPPQATEDDPPTATAPATNYLADNLLKLSMMNSNGNSNGNGGAFGSDLNELPAKAPGFNELKDPFQAAGDGFSGRGGGDNFGQSLRGINGAGDACFADRQQQDDLALFNGFGQAATNNALVANLSALVKLNELQQKQQQLQAASYNYQQQQHQQTGYASGAMPPYSQVNQMSSGRFGGDTRYFQHQQPKQQLRRPRVPDAYRQQHLQQQQRHADYEFLMPANNRSDLETSSLLRSMSAMASSSSDSQQQLAALSNHPQLPLVAAGPVGGASLGSRPMSMSDCYDMQIRCKFGQLGEGRGMFNSPHGFCLGKNEEIVVADTHNHRIQFFDKNGNFLYHFGLAGKEEGRLWFPRKVAVIPDSGLLVICDRGGERSRMQIFTPQGHFVRRIQIRFIDIVAGLAINRHGHIVAVDSVTPTVFVISQTGELLRYHECADFMAEPSDIAVPSQGSEYYICDFKGHSVVVLSEDGQFLRRIGNESVTHYPNGIDISDEGDILVGDSHGNQFHVAVFDRMGSLLSQFMCPSVKVSRCCGLKITSEGFVVTLAKNNHHALVLNTLYVN